MSTTFPSGLDTFVNPQSDDLMSLVPHHSQHADANDAIEALQTKVGLNSSTDANSLDYQMTHHTHTTSSVTDFNTKVSTQTDVAANTLSRHTHANKSTLDTLSKSQSDLLDRTNHTGTQSTATLSDFSESVDSRVNGLVAAGNGVTKAYDDVANTLTLSVTPNSTNQKVAVSNTGTAIGTRGKLNFMAGNGLSCETTDNTENDQVDITISTLSGSSFSW